MRQGQGIAAFSTVFTTFNVGQQKMNLTSLFDETGEFYRSLVD